MNYHPTAPADQARHHPERIFQAGLALHHIANTAYPIGHLTTMRPYRVITPEAQRLAPPGLAGFSPPGPVRAHSLLRAALQLLRMLRGGPAADCDSRGGLLRRSGAGVDLYRQALGDSACELTGFDIGGGTPLGGADA